MQVSSIPVEALTYEQAFHEMEEIVTALEDAPLSLEDSMLLFERGQSLSLRCTTLLDQAELRLTRLQQPTGDQ